MPTGAGATQASKMRRDRIEGGKEECGGRESYCQESKKGSCEGEAKDSERGEGRERKATEEKIAGCCRRGDGKAMKGEEE